jgi:hypothetical protein
VRDSTGIIQARLMAEKDNPRNDVIFGARRHRPAGARRR